MRDVDVLHHIVLIRHDLLGRLRTTFIHSFPPTLVIARSLRCPSFARIQLTIANAHHQLTTLSFVSGTHIASPRNSLKPQSPSCSRTSLLTTRRRTSYTQMTGPHRPTIPSPVRSFRARTGVRRRMEQPQTSLSTASSILYSLQVPL